MIVCIKNFLLEKGFAQDKIHCELFTIPGVKQSAIKTTEIKKEDEGPKAKVKVKVDGILFDFELGFESESILDAALKQGADLPYACKGGVCTTCKARLMEGKVHMDVNWSLEPEELEKGYILTCQSHPVTKTVTVDFDAK